MRLKEPDFSLKDTFLSCVRYYRKNSTIAEKMMNIQPYLLDDEKQYKENISELYILPEHSDGLYMDEEEISNKNLKDLYSNKLINKKNKDSRKFYDRLLTSSPICPYCGERQVTTIDHFLPKSKYANFSITPINLIPCCYVCNMNKRDIVPTNEKDLLFHPYFEDIAEMKWLFADLEINNLTVIFNYYVKLEGYDVIAQRLKNEVKKLNLLSYYSEKAGTEFSYFAEYYSKLYNNGSGEEVVVRSLKEGREKARYRPMKENSIEYVMYDTLLENIEKVYTIL